jgi:hypothetical protein
MSLRLRVVLGALLALGCFGILPASAADSSTPDYVVINLQVQVNRPAEQVWKKVGEDYCAIVQWLKVTCKLSSGSGEVGTVRVINDTTIEPMVAKTPWSYTYTQTAGAMAPRTYHGTIAIEPNGTGKSVLKYTLFYNQAVIATDAERASEHTRIATRFQGALDAMKAIAEAQP